MPRKLKTIKELDTYPTTSAAAGARGPAINSVPSSNLQLLGLNKIKTPKSLVIESLIEQLCHFYEDDSTKRNKLFQEICRKLSNLRVFSSEEQLQTTQPVRYKFRVAFAKYINEIQTSIKWDIVPNEVVASLLPEWKQRSNLSSCLFEVDIFQSDFYELYTKQYERDFEELALIDKGAFGIVYKAKKKVENVVYAVKKIPFSCDNDMLLPKVLKEVELFARLSHTNIVGYKTAWIEPETGDVWKLFGSSKESYSSDQSSLTNLNSAVPNTGDVFDDVANSADETLIENEMKLKPEQFEEMLEVMCEKYDSLEEEKELFRNLKLNKEDTLKLGPRLRRNAARKNKSSLVASTALVRSQMNAVCFDNGGFTLSKLAVLYVQMELCKESLRIWIDKRNETNYIDYKKVTEIFKQILKGVQYLHSEKLLHRDLKPQNILFDYQDKIKIGDFGLATDCCGNKCSNNNFQVKNRKKCNHKHSRGVGTSPYAAPEVKNGTNYDYKADMYSLGIILLELFHPFKTGMERVRVLDDLNRSKLPQQLSDKYPEQSRMILLLTNRNPKLRPSANEVLESTVVLSKSQVIENQNLNISNLKKKLAQKKRENFFLKRRIRELENTLNKINLNKS